MRRNQGMNYCKRHDVQHPGQCPGCACEQYRQSARAWRSSSEVWELRYEYGVEKWPHDLRWHEECRHRAGEALEEYRIAKRASDNASDVLRKFRARPPVETCGNDCDVTAQRIIVECEDQAAQRLGNAQ